ncbi:manganese efflux pump MntP family protein [Patescibacteria group bacterium]|nr:manganese efflux pump MntP family protein [Patescibacteria group bacterium]MBU1673476.1 manganese efflux pump MntP family protein [Patescibacteria group bacterium]MBU1963993.1 manganese efflux pump MntP family protein [Patescibacteria group bacterium]
MSIFTTIFIGIGLAMDAMAVSVTSGMAIKKIKVWPALKIALFFGVFQGIMPLLGWLIGSSIKDYISGFDHWIAFILLFAIGAKLIWEAIKNRKGREADEVCKDPHNNIVLLGLAVATSIDALAVGLSYSFLGSSIIFPALVFALITFALSLVGIYLGHKGGKRLGWRAEILGGIILILIGVKILVEHM